jgi:sugar phosphate isomerase/epimerase
MSDMMIYTTVADYMRLPRYKYMPSFVSYERQQDLLKAVPMGDGFIDYKTFFTALKDCGYDGYVAYEMCSELQGGGSEENLDMYARRFVDFMKQF